MTVVDCDVDQAQALLGSVDVRPERVDDSLGVRSDAEIVGLVTELETLARRIGALQVAVMGQIEDRRLYGADGHASAKVMVRHLSRLSCGEAAGRDKARRVLARLPAVNDAYVAGAIGTEQVRLLGRVYANRRVAPYMAERAQWFVEQAQVLSYPDFEQVIRHWERLTDQSGAEPAAERCHERRDFRMVQDHFGLGWEIRGGLGSVAGAAIDEIFQHYVQAQWQADWDQAKAEHGDQATVDDLARSAGQRRADALWQIFQDAASTPPHSKAPRFVHNIVWDAAGYEQILAELSGKPRQPLDIDSFRCATIDGIDLAPSETILNSLVNEFRRVIIDAAGVVIDLGTARRFTGSARLAVQLQAVRCPWTGCVVRTSRCEIDHIQPHSQGGSTNPGNGAPLCGRHNRWKQKGFTIWRDPTGHWHTYRPNGTEIL